MPGLPSASSSSSACRDFGDARGAGLLVGILFVVLASAAAHLLFSWMGFNPSDDGFVLAYSRRLLGGQMPHRDFISIRPVGSALLHAPAVLLGGDSVFWLSRLLVWLEFSCVAWVWTGIAAGRMKLRFGAWERVLLAVIALALSAHSFPAMAWHTTDAVFLSSAGLALCVRASRRAELAGYALVGLACLCKQNFLVMAPAALLALGGWRRLGPWLAAAAPGVVYLAWLAAAGALPDAWAQMTAQAGLLQAGVIPYLVVFSFPWGILLGYLAAAGALRQSVAAQRVGSATLCAVPLAFILLLAAGMHVRVPAFGLYGVAAGATACLLRERAAGARTGLLLLALGWAASLSLGYNSPALVAGPLALLLIGIASRAPAGILSARLPRRRALLAALGVVVAAAWFHLRQEHVYLDRPARQLTEPLGGLFPGTRHLWTNPNTRAALADLQAAIALAGGKPFAIIPDFPAYWVKAPQRNPLPIDWAQGTELASPALLQRVLDTLDGQRGRPVVIVQKFDARFLPLGLVPLEEPGRYRVVQHVRARFARFAETRFFDLYQ